MLIILCYSIWEMQFKQPCISTYHSQLSKKNRTTNAGEDVGKEILLVDIDGIENQLLWELVQRIFQRLKIKSTTPGICTKGLYILCPR